jgi:hypothetical protein
MIDNKIKSKKVFISAKITNPDNTEQKTADYKFALKLYDRLKENGLEPFFSEHDDVQEQMANQGYEEFINQWLKYSDAFVFLSTEEKYLESIYISAEIETYINDMDSGKKNKDSFFRFNAFGKFDKQKIDNKFDPLINRLNKINNISLNTSEIDKSIDNLSKLIIESFK